VLSPNALELRSPTFCVGIGRGHSPPFLRPALNIQQSRQTRPAPFALNDLSRVPGPISKIPRSLWGSEMLGDRDYQTFGFRNLPLLSDMVSGNWLAFNAPSRICLMNEA
jgi:hypothetical protein